MSEIYKDIAERCAGNVYIGVVGPVRTGKSTFIKRFMESLVLPNIDDENVRKRAVDEMPQSAGGKTVMTTEPKFVPDEPVKINIGENASMNVKMIDCVGYTIPEVMGLDENGEPRMVHTPWSSEPMPFKEAAELGTRKVISEHATIGVVVTTDGSIAEIERESYVDAEKRVIDEVKDRGIPFVIVLNSASPASPDAIALAEELEKCYRAPVALVNCVELDGEDIGAILSLVLSEFPIKELRVEMPEWTRALPDDHEIRKSIREYVYSRAKQVRKISELDGMFDDLSECSFASSANFKRIDLGCGVAVIDIELTDGLYYETLSRMTDLDISCEEDMIMTLVELSHSKKKYERVADAFERAQECGYGIVMPDASELKLEEPEIVKQASGYGVKLRASAPSIHMIKAGIETEISPVVGTEQQSEDLVKYLLAEFEDDPSKIWNTNMFGKTLYDLVNDGLHAKLENMPDDARTKLSQTLGRIINEGSGGLICIIL